MRIQFLTKAERDRLNQFPTEIPREDLITFFTLTENDFSQIPQRSADFNRLGFALQLGTLRYLGFCPDNLHQAPFQVVDYVASQLSVNATTLENYGQRNQTRTEHLRNICNYLSFRKASDDDVDTLKNWLLNRALEHDKPTLLFHLACQWLHQHKILRPGITTVEKIVVTARQQAQEETYHQLNVLLTDERREVIDKLLTPIEDSSRTQHFWLRHGAVSNTPDAILNNIEKLQFLYALGVDQWNLSSLNPNRQKFLAAIGRRSNNQVLQRMTEMRRYPVLIAFLRQSLVDIIDELLDIFDRCLWDTYTRAQRENKEHRLKLAKTTNEKLILFQKIGELVLDADIPDPQLRDAIYTVIPYEELREEISECNQLIRPKDDQSIDYFAKRYSYVRRFAKKLLGALDFHSNRENEPILLALEELKMLNETKKRKVSASAPLSFIPDSWLRYVLSDNGEVARQYYELSALLELRGALRAGDVWVKNSRRYANPESYLIPKNQWTNLRTETLRLLGLPQTGEERLNQRTKELEQSLTKLEQQVRKDDNVRIENDKLTFTPLDAYDLPDSCLQLRKLITQRLPHLDLTDLLIEVDGWTNFTAHLTHASGKQQRVGDLLTYLYASILAQACNFGLTKMAELASLTYDQLAIVICV